MEFKDKEIKAEYEAFAAYYALRAKRTRNAATQSRLNQLRSIAIGDYGNGAFQELLRENKREAPTKPETTGKAQGGGNRRGQPPAMPKAPQAGSPRHLRLQERGVLQESKSAASEVAAAGKTAESLIEGTKHASKTVRQAGATADELSAVQLSTGATFDTETGRTENSLLQDAVVLSAKELSEKYGRDLMFEYLFNAGHDREVLEQKSDRQLANLLKKEAEK